MGDISRELLIRAAQPHDAAAVDELILHLDEFHAAARPDLFRVPPAKPRGEDFFRESLDDANQAILVASNGAKVIGYVHILIKRTDAGGPRLERRYSEIDTICVSPAARGLGAGRRLIEAALDWARAKGVQDHQIAVHEFNGRARRIYEEMGFIPSVVVMRQHES